ncbi:hypothetical protein FNYG_05743 [Fusarium nygamai]|uniref:ATP-dependent RNA helicase n=1 Tax=Gibberella nygamai TaxID=42673 RepID=A0A2K0WF70_GIBNY|nr:hypothetical protein FNYG_05743 [Fusarium nygamai]
MPSSNQILSVLAAVAVATANAAMGPAFSTGPVGSGSWIREATSTLVLPDVPQGSTGVASLWVGMGTDKGDLIQSIADNWQSDEWSIFAYTLTKTGDNSQLPVQDEHQTPAKKGDRVTMHYKYDTSTQEYVQYVSINGKQVSTLSTSKGHEAMGFGSSVECGASDCGTIGAHQWVDTKIILDTADPNYIQTFGKGEGVTGGEMTTSDGGKTWVISDPLRQLYTDPKADEDDAPRQSIDIVAVHGLGPPAKGEAKHAFDTWRTPSGQKGCSWLQEDLPGHIPDSRIFLYQYNTTGAYGRGLDGFRSKADNLLEAINIERRDCPERPILLLGHSTGGLLIKQALINAHSNPGYNAIKDDTTGIVFFGTPHEFITQKLGEIVTAIARELGHEPQGDLVESLQAGNIFSEHESWKHQALQYNTVSFWGSSDTIVSRNNVSLGLPGDLAKVVELDASHRGLCKFGNSDRDQYNLKIVVENLKRLYELAIEKPESQYDAYPDTSGVETPRTSEDYGQDEHHDVLEEIQRVALSTANDTEQPIMTPSQESQLEGYEAVVEDSLKTTFDHSTIKGAPAFTGTALQDLHVAENQAMPSGAQDKLYSRMPFELLILQVPVLQGVRYLNYQKPTNVQEAVLSTLMLHPPRNVMASYPPGTGRTTALAIALLSRIFFFSTTQPQVLVIVPTRLLVRQTQRYIKEMGRFCKGLVVETITAPSKPTAKVEANVIIGTPGSLLDCIRRRLVDTSLVRFLLMDDVDYLVELPGLSDQCINVVRRLPATIQFLLFSDLSTRVSDFTNTMLQSSTYEKHEFKSAELHAYKIVHLFFRCSGDTGEQEKLDIICKLPGVVTISTLIIFVQSSPDAQRIHHVLATQGYAVANLFDAADSVEMEEILDKFKAGQAKVLITKDCKTRGLDLPSSSMVISYDIPDADARRYLRQVSRAGKAGRSGFAVSLVSDEKESADLQSVATSQCFNLRELKSDDWDAVENFLRDCTKSQRL